jgi:mRNA interferase MazF
MNQLRAGDLHWIKPSRTKGREQSRRRPGLIVSDSRLSTMGLCWVVPTSTTDRGWPTHIRLDVDRRTTFAMCEQLRSISTQRVDSRIGTVDDQTLSEVRSILRELVGY